MRAPDQATRRRIYLSPPHMGGDELGLVQEAFDSNWIAPVGPHLTAFEQEVAEVAGVAHAVALSSGTAALHLALEGLGVCRGDDVICPTLTFAASANAITYLGARPVFVDAEATSWNLDPDRLEEALAAGVAQGRPVKAVVTVDLYGQAADYDRILPVCERYGVPVVEDAAEALGATHGARDCGSFGRAAVFSFNGNKIITTSGGGMLVSDDDALVERARFLSTQARDPAPHYQHSEIGYNYRMSNVLAAIGRGQLRVLPDRVRARRAHFDAYRAALSDLPGVALQPEAPWGRTTRWLTVLTLDPAAFGVDREAVRVALEADDIEARPVWKPMHLQPAFAGCPTFGGDVASHLFDHGLCLPSGSSLTDDERQRVIDGVRRCAGA